MAVKIGPAPKPTTARAKDLLGMGFRAQKWKFSRCLAPRDNCQSNAINSHSIQNAGVLDLLCRDGHVKMIKTRPEGLALVTDFFDVGRHEASTFHGLCQTHDTSIFRPIDVRPFSLSDSEQKFLMAYRSVLQEVHATIQAASKIQSTYQHRVTLGIDSGNEPEPAGMYALERMMVAYDTYCYKATLDEYLENGNFDGFLHTSFVVSHVKPCIAVSGFFDLQSLPINTPTHRIALNVFPVSERETIVLFSYTDEDRIRSEEYIREVVAATGEFQKYLLSKLILTHCENFVVSPSLFDTWSSEKRDAICEFFHVTAEFDKQTGNSDLYLF